MQEALSKRRNINALVGEKAGFYFGLSLAGPYTVLTALAAQLTTSAVAIGSITTIWNGALFLPVVFVARWIRGHTERMPIVRKALFSRAVAFPLIALWLLLTRAANPGLTLAIMIAGMLLFCLSDGTNSIPYVDVIARIMTSQERARMTWRGMLAGGLLGILGGLIVQYFLTPGVLAFPVNFAALLGLAGVGFLFAWGSISMVSERDVQASRPHTIDGGAQAPRAARTILSHDAVYRRMLITRFMTNIDQMAVPFYTVFALNVLKMTPETVGWFVAAQTVGALVAPILFGRLAERSGAHRVILAGSIMQTLAPLVALLVTILASRNSVFSGLMVVIFTITGFSTSTMSLGFYNYPLDWCADHERPNYLALLSVVSATAMLAPLIGGYIAQTISYPFLFGATSLLVGMGALVSTTLPDKRH